MQSRDLNTPKLLDSIRQLEVKIDLSKPQPTPGEYALLYYGEDQPINITKKDANKILFLDDKGVELIRKNTGHSHPEKLEGVYYKKAPGITGLATLYEQSVYQVNQLLQGGIVAPTQTIRIDVHNQTYTAQASLAVDGPTLDDIIRVPVDLRYLEDILQNKELLNVLAELINDIYFTEWEKKNKKVLSLDQQCEILKEKLIAPPDEKQEALTVEYIKGFLNDKSALRLIAFLERFPQLCQNPLENLIHFPDLFQTLKKLYYPKKPAVTSEMGSVIQKAKDVLSHFDAESISKHIVLSLLTHPRDHRSENFIVCIEHDNNDQLLPFNLVAIDNDDALHESVGINKDGNKKIVIKHKSILWAIPEILNQELHTKVRGSIASLKPEVAVLDFLTKMHNYTQSGPLKQVFKNEFDSDLKKNNLSFFDIRLLNLLNKLQTILNDEPKINLENLIQKTEPVTWWYYSKLRSHYPRNIKVFESELCSPRDSLEDLFGSEYPEFKNAVLRQEKKQNPCFRTYEEAILNLISTCQMFNHKDLMATISQTNLPEGNYCEIVGLNGKRYLSPEAYSQIFPDKATKFPETKHYGRQAFTKVTCSYHSGLNISIRLRKFPSHLGHELMVYYLSQHVFGYITPQVSILKFKKVKNIHAPNRDFDIYPVLVTNWIEGKELKRVLKESPEQLNECDKVSISQAIILAMLINPRESCADDYMVEKVDEEGKIKYHLRSIENGQVFVNPIKQPSTDKEAPGSDELQVKTILYCLNDMKSTLPASVREYLITLNPHKIVKNWLKDLEQVQGKINDMFDESLKKVDKISSDLPKDEREKLNIQIKTRPIEDIYKKIVRLKDKLNENPDITHMDLLRHLEPSLGARYDEVFLKYADTEKRFEELTKSQTKKATPSMSQSEIKEEALTFKNAYSYLAKIQNEYKSQTTNESKGINKEIINNDLSLTKYKIYLRKIINIYILNKVIFSAQRKVVDYRQQGIIKLRQKIAEFDGSTVELNAEVTKMLGGMSSVEKQNGIPWPVKGDFKKLMGEAIKISKNLSDAAIVEDDVIDIPEFLTQAQMLGTLDISNTDIYGTSMVKTEIKSTYQQLVCWRLEESDRQLNKGSLSVSAAALVASSSPGTFSNATGDKNNDHPLAAGNGKTP